MREKLIQYVSLLFAGADGCEDIKQEILQNTLDRYDDLIAEGKPAEAAYRLAIVGIGDINEILGQAPEAVTYGVPAAQQPVQQDTMFKKILRAAGIGLYIICPVPMFLLSEMEMATVGLCGTLFLVAVATMLMVLGGKKKSELPQKPQETSPSTPQQELRKSIGSMVWAIGVAVYFIVSFLTNAWHITWLVFPITGALQGLVLAIYDLKEENSHA